MESTGRPGSIQVSEETAAFLKADNKSHWLVERKDKVMAKGKGMMKTYWVAFGTESQQHTSQPSASSEMSGPVDMDFSASSFGGMHDNNKFAGTGKAQQSLRTTLNSDRDVSTSSYGGVHSNLYSTSERQDSPRRVRQAVDVDASTSSFGGVHSNMYPADLREMGGNEDKEEDDDGVGVALELEE